MNIVVVGAGIGGLTFALSAHRLGMNIRVYESAAELRPLGVGLNLQPNAVRELTELGLGEMLASTGIPTAELAYYSKHGQRIWSEPRGLAAGYKWPQYSIHRGALQMGLLDAVRGRLGRDSVVAGHHFSRFERNGSSIISRFVDRVTREPLATAEADVLIGADGFHSEVRKQLYPGEGPPRYGKWVAFRGAVEAEPFLSGKTMVSVGTRDKRVVAYPISREAMDRGKALINWVASLPMPPAGPLPPEEWNRTVAQELILPEFETWRFSWLDVAGLFERTSEVYQFPFVDREPIPKWSVGRVTLQGDAAHPMYPIGSQAGSQAIVDARVLASALAAIKDPTDALQRYEDVRMTAMNTLVVKNRELGAENVLQIVEDLPQTALRRTSSARKSWRRRRAASRDWPASTSTRSTTARPILAWRERFGSPACGPGVVLKRQDRRSRQCSLRIAVNRDPRWPASRPAPKSCQARAAKLRGLVDAAAADVAASGGARPSRSDDIEGATGGSHGQA